MVKAVIDVYGLKKSFGDRVAVDGVDLHIPRGEVFGFLGPNGSGKTTTLRMLCGLLTPDAGRGTCLDYDILTDSKKIKAQVGYMTQRYSFYEDLTVEENLDFVARVYAVNHRKQKIMDTLHQMNLFDRRNQLTAHLSGGWKQRMALAACLLHEPALLLLDEPTAGIDPIARREFWDIIHRLSEQGMTTLLSTHYMDEAERCTRLAYLAYSKLLITGTVDDVISASKLNTWEIYGNISTTLLQHLKKIQGVTQAAYFGRHIHVCGTDIENIERQLQALAEASLVQYRVITPTLEDAFIALVNRSPERWDE